MKKLAGICILVLMINCVGTAQNSSKETKTYKVEKTDAEWKEQLSPIVYNVLREAVL